MLDPLPIPTDHWRSRWLVLPSWNVLHRVASIEWTGDDEDDMRHGQGTTVCGRKGWLSMPGMLSRMSLPRCAHCCHIAGVPRGDGAPANYGIREAADA